MKVSLLIVWCILCTWVTNAQKISFSGQVCRFDTITESDGPVVHDFYFTNTGEKPLKIKEVLTSCGCVAASFPSGEVMPGEKAAVRVIYRPENRHEEEVLAIADVYTNAGVRTLEISGVVLRSKKERQPAYRLRESDVREYVRPSKPARGFGLILERMREGLLARVNVPENDAEVKEQVAALDRGGKWADLDYACYGRTNWEPIRHLQRVYQQVLSYVNPESIYYANDTLYTVIRDALGYWLECRPKCHNWWYNQIAVPQCLGNMLVLMECGKKRLSGELRDGLFRLMAWPDPRRWTGANKQDIALHHVQRGCLLENDSIVKAAVDELFYPLRFTNQEGLQVDYSYHQHGNQLYIGGYGAVFVECVLKAAEWFRDTPYALKDEQLEMFSRFFRDTYLNIFRGPYQDFSVLGRGISREGATLSRGMAGVLERMKEIDRKHADDYEKAKVRFNGVADSCRSDCSRVFWRSDYALHNRKAFDFSVRTSSVRTCKIESGNGENLKGALLSDGAVCLRVTGEEYYDIFPVWDWNRIPGVTALDSNAGLQAADWGRRGKAVFSGGVSDGTYSAMGYRMDDFGVKAQKAWFMFDDEVVCLGTGIYGQGSGRVCTTVEQCRNEGENVIRKGNKIRKGNVLYYFPAGGKTVCRENRLQTGAWSEKNYNYPVRQVGQPVFSLWIDHGNNPQNAGYAYVIVPGAQQAENYDTARIEIVRNDTLVQAVYQKHADILQIVCYDSVRFEGSGVALEVDIPCVLMVKGIKTRRPSLYLADPMQDKKTAHVCLTTSRVKLSRKVELPQDDWKGNTIEILK